MSVTVLSENVHVALVLVGGDVYESAAGLTLEPGKSWIEIPVMLAKSDGLNSTGNPTSFLAGSHSQGLEGNFGRQLSRRRSRGERLRRDVSTEPGKPRRGSGHVAELHAADPSGSHDACLDRRVRTVAQDVDGDPGFDLRHDDVHDGSV